MHRVTVQRMAGPEFMSQGPFGVCWPSIGLVDTKEAYAFAIQLARAIEAAEQLNKEDDALRACNGEPQWHKDIPPELMKSEF